MPKTRKNLADLARSGFKHQVRMDANAVPVNVMLTDTNHNELKQLLVQSAAVLPIRGARNRPLSKPKVIYRDCGDDFESRCGRNLESGISPGIARCVSCLGKLRRVVEHTHSSRHGFYRPHVRFEQQLYIHAVILLTCLLEQLQLNGAAFSKSITPKQIARHVEEAYGAHYLLLPRHLVEHNQASFFKHDQYSLKNFTPRSLA